MATVQNPKSEIPEPESNPQPEPSLVPAPAPSGSLRSRLARAWRAAPVLVLIALALAPRLYLFNPTRAVSPDAVDYVNIARNLASHRGFTQTIKWHFFTADPVVHSAVGERPPLYPVLVSVLMQQGGQLATIDFVNILLAVAAVLLLFFLYEKATGSRWIAFLAALLTATNPGMAMASVFPWTESLYLLLQTASLLLLMVGMERLARLSLQPASAGPAQTDSPMPAPESKSRAKALQHAEYCLLAAGFAAALAYLTRPNALAFIAALVLVLLVSRAWRSLALFLFPCAAMLAIWFALVWAVKGDPFYSVQNHHLRVAYITDGMRAGWGAHIPTAAEFARTHSIPRLIASSAWKYITFLFSPMYFSFLAIGLLALPALLPRRNLMVLALAGLLHFVLVGATWSTFEPDRLLHPVFVCLLPLCLIAPWAALQWALARWRWQASRARIARAALALLLAAAALGLAATGYATGLRARQYYIAHMPSAPPLTPDHRLLAYRFLLPDAVIATDDPFLCNLRIDRPTIYFPEKITEQNAPDFFRQFMVRFVALTNPQDPKVQPVLSALVAQGALQPLSQSFDPAFQWFLVNETIFDKTAPAK